MAERASDPIDLDTLDVNDDGTVTIAGPGRVKLVGGYHHRWHFGILVEREPEYRTTWPVTDDASGTGDGRVTEFVSFCGPPLPIHMVETRPGMPPTSECCNECVAALRTIQSRGQLPKRLVAPNARPAATA